MSIISGTIGAIMGAESQDKATKANKDNVRKTNELNYKMFQESRGSGGSAVLPLYLKTKSGQLFETKLGEDLVAAYDSMAPGSVEDYRARMASTGPMRESALKAVGGLFDGSMEAGAIERFKPVAAARTGVRRQAAMEGLAKTLAEIDAANAGSGISGDSMSRRLLQFEANKGASGEIAGAELANMEEERAIRDYYAQQQLTNAGLPYQLAKDEMAYFRMPEEEYMNSIMRRLEPLKFLYLGAGNAFRNEQMPMEQPSVSPWQLLAQGGAQAGNIALDYWLKNQQARNWGTAANWGNAAAAGNLAGSLSTGSGAALAGAADVSPELMAYIGSLA